MNNQKKKKRKITNQLSFKSWYFNLNKWLSWQGLPIIPFILIPRQVTLITITYIPKLYGLIFLNRAHVCLLQR